MQTLRRLDGSIITVDRFMQLPSIAPNHMQRDMDGTLVEVFGRIEPNETEKLFGYEVDVFLRKQYK